MNAALATAAKWAPPSARCPAFNDSVRLDTTLVGELRTSIAAAGQSNLPLDGAAPPRFIVVNGRDNGPAREWSYREFEFSAAGEALAWERYRALVAGSEAVQS